jgi:hypothetical protein
MAQFGGIQSFGQLKIESQIYNIQTEEYAFAAFMHATFKKLIFFIFV